MSLSDQEVPGWNRLETCLLTRQIGNYPISSISYDRKVPADVLVEIILACKNARKKRKSQINFVPPTK
jgi:hypothetical protein